MFTRLLLPGVTPMVVARSLSEIRYDANSVVTIGTFDGVHRGHQAILQEVLSLARARSGRSVVVTFDPHPRDVLGQGPVEHLTTLNERLALIEHMGIGFTLVLEFTYDFSRQGPAEFYERYVVNGVGVAEVVEGHDHMFGRDRQAGVEALLRLGKQYGFTSVTVPPVTLENETVSSTVIREALLSGDIGRPQHFLGRPYTLSGIVVRGNGRGGQLGFPTVNVQPLAENKVIPAHGVYVVKVRFDHAEFYGMLNIGIRPTFVSNGDRTIEIHLFNTAEEFYDKKLTIHFLKRLRHEKKFVSTKDLISQLQDDRATSMKYIETLQAS